MNIIKYITNKKYRFFLKKIKNVDKSIWEYEFKISKSRQVREGIRKDRDRVVENKNHLETKISEEKDEKLKKGFEKDLEQSKEMIKKYEGQMKLIDDQINGVLKVEPNDEYPDGIPPQVGILETIESLTELKLMYNEYLKQI